MQPYKKSGKGGRPRRAPDEVRTYTLGVCVNKAEMDAVRRKADCVGLSVSHWLRQVALSRLMPRPRVPEVNRETYAELARLAGNLNQLARAAHEGRATVPGALLQATHDAIKHLRLELLGVADDSQNSEG